LFGIYFFIRENFVLFVVAKDLENMLEQLDALEPDLTALERAYFVHVSGYTDLPFDERSTSRFLGYVFGEICNVQNAMWHGEEDIVPEVLRGYSFFEFDKLGERFELYATVLVDENFGREVGKAYGQIYSRIDERYLAEVNEGKHEDVF
tara:strand:- start:17 stop:463 length:447 start_codon:yes stop_codon:yes gene_type:complete